MGRYAKTPLFISFFLVLFVLAGCDSSSSNDGDSLGQEPADISEGLKKSSVAYNNTPDFASSDLETLIGGFSDFTIDFYHALRRDPSTKDENLFFSTYSIENALAMTWAGARSNTADEMADALHLNLPQNRFHPTLNALNIDINSRDDQLPPSGDAFQLKLVNAIWSRIGYPLLPSYLDIIAENYNAGVRTLDFAGNPDGSRQVINQWVEDQTNEKIRDLLPPNAIGPLTTLVLTNAIYFKASWFQKFDENLTSPADFFLLDGSTVNVDMMNHKQLDTKFFQGNGFDVVELPYASPMYEENQYPEELSMMIIIPHLGMFETIESNLDYDSVDFMAASMQMGTIDFALPSFEFEFEVECKDIMQQLGMLDAFDPYRADFSGMVDPVDSKPWIDEIYHKAFVAVDEEGTEAAAATAVVMRVTSMPDPVKISADRPFIFLIRDNITGAILFMGRVVDPTA